MACLSHPEASTETCRPCGMTYCTGSGCGHTCPPSGLQIFDRAEDGPEEFQEFLAGAARVDAVVIAVSLSVAKAGDVRRPEIHLAFKVPCGCPHEECEETEGVIMHLSMENASRLQEGIETHMSSPEHLLKVMGLMDKPTS